MGGGEGVGAATDEDGASLRTAGPWRRSYSSRMSCSTKPVRSEKSRALINCWALSQSAGSSERLVLRFIRVQVEPRVAADAGGQVVGDSAEAMLLDDGAAIAKQRRGKCDIHPHGSLVYAFALIGGSVVGRHTHKMRINIRKTQ